MADDIAAFMRAAGVGRAHVFGLSLGGAIGRWLAAKHPEQVRSLSLHSTARPEYIDGLAEFLRENVEGFNTQTLDRTGSLPLAADAAARAAAVAGAQGHLHLDVRADRVIMCLQTAAVGWVTERDVQLAQRITAAAAELRLDNEGQSVQVLKIGIDTLAAAAIRARGATASTSTCRCRTTRRNRASRPPWRRAGSCSWLTGPPRTRPCRC